MTRRIENALLVDDDDAFRTTLQSALRRRGVTARTAATVEEGGDASGQAGWGLMHVQVTGWVRRPGWPVWS